MSENKCFCLSNGKGIVEVCDYCQVDVTDKTPMTIIAVTDALSDQHNGQTPPAICSDSYQRSNQRDEKSAIASAVSAPTQEPMWDERAWSDLTEAWKSDDKILFYDSIAELKAQLEKMAELLKQSEANHSFFQNESKQIWYEKKELQQQLAKLQQECDGVYGQLATMNDIAKRRREEIAKLQQENEELSDEVQKLTAELAEERKC